MNPLLNVFLVLQAFPLDLSNQLYVDDNALSVNINRIREKLAGIGLYLCKRLCEKLGIGITAESSEHGTAISLSFHINCLI